MCVHDTQLDATVDAVVSEAEPHVATSSTFLVFFEFSHVQKT